MSENSFLDKQDTDKQRCVKSKFIRMFRKNLKRKFEEFKQGDNCIAIAKVDKVMAFVDSYFSSIDQEAYA